MKIFPKTFLRFTFQMNYSAPKISKAKKMTSTMAALVSSQSEQSSSNATKNNEDKERKFENLICKCMRKFLLQ